MSDHDSIAVWLLGARAGDETAAQRLWQRYFEQLVRRARRHLPAHRKRAYDEEDVAHSALRCFFHGIAAERYPQLNDRHGLWNLLVVITARKAKEYLRNERRAKRGGGRVQGETAFLDPDQSDVAGIEQVIGAEPTPAFAVQVAEECERLLERLGDDDLRRIALLKMEGHSIEEIAEEVDCAKRTVERRLHIIRKTWEQAV
ncbi:MAG: ECF-type sigma factor [Gemmataceae bacterium]|nr:ECF-type sigma factor [Gemmataceae bacterium]